MEILFEILLELVLPLIAEVFAEFALHSLGRIPWVRATGLVILTAIMYFGVGLLSGGYGQEELERSGAIRVYEDPADLLKHLDEVGGRPVLGGLLMSYIAWLRVRTWDWTIRLEAFAYGFLFAFAMALLRLLFTQ